MNAIRPPLKTLLIALGVLVVAYLLLRRPAQEVTVSAPAGATGSTATPRTYEIVTLLPRDAIPAIDEPQFYEVIVAVVTVEDLLSPD